MIYYVTHIHSTPSYHIMSQCNDSTLPSGWQVLPSTGEFFAPARWRGLHWQPSSASAVHKGRAPRCLVASLASKQTRSCNLSVSGAMHLRCCVPLARNTSCGPSPPVGALCPPCRWVAAPAPGNPAPVVASLRGSGVALRSVAPGAARVPPVAARWRGLPALRHTGGGRSLRRCAPSLGGGVSPPPP
jgi:hypothetical protein